MTGPPAPHRAIFDLSSEATDRAAAADPLHATAMGVTGHDHLWTDFSPDGYAERLRLATELRSRAAACPVGDKWDRLAQRVLSDNCSETIDFVDGGDHLDDLNNIASPLQAIRSVFELMATDSTEAWENIAVRLETIDVALDGYRASLELGRQSGRTVALRQAEEAHAQAVAAAGAGSSFEKLDTSSIADPALASRIASATAHARASFGAFATYLEQTYVPAARPADEVGRDAYARRARRFLGTDLDLDATYLWGWDEVARLGDELRAACSEFDPGADPSAVLDRLQTDQTLAASSLDEFIEIMTERQQVALADLDGRHFEVPEEVRSVEVRVQPAGGALAPNYSPPSEDFSRPGIVWYPFEGREMIPLYDQVTTAYHEGFPGHHLQIGLQVVEAERLSRLHKLVVWYPGSGEGWALYAETLMDELGYLERPEYRVGYLVSALFRACRIVIDIGTHLQLPIPADATFHAGESWSYDVALEMLTDVACQPHDIATSEVVRYFGWPGQAISYKVGERAIQQLRADAESRPDFDIAAFHGELLGYGSVGLDLLAELMNPTQRT